jgi:hypothetical protein
MNTHRRNFPTCAKCGGICEYDDEGNPAPVFGCPACGEYGVFGHYDGRIVCQAIAGAPSAEVKCPCCGETGYDDLQDCSFCESEGHNHDLQTWYVVTRHMSGVYLVRTWQAQDYEHAMEQQLDFISDDGDEELVCASITEPMFYGSVLA